MPPVGRHLVQVEAPSRLPDDAQALEELRDERQAYFDDMHGIVRYRETHLLEKPYFSASARYRAPDQPHHEKTEAWLQRTSGEDNVGLYTQTIRNVGKRWKRVDDPKLIARTTDEGDVAYGEEDPEFYENVLPVKKQKEASANLADTLAAVKAAEKRYRRNPFMRFLGRRATGIDVKVETS